MFAATALIAQAHTTTACSDDGEAVSKVSLNNHNSNLYAIGYARHGTCASGESLSNVRRIIYRVYIADGDEIEYGWWTCSVNEGVYWYPTAASMANFRSVITSRQDCPTNTKLWGHATTLIELTNGTWLIENSPWVEQEAH
jgi:hypothetical protein